MNSELFYSQANDDLIAFFVRPYSGFEAKYLIGFFVMIVMTLIAQNSRIKRAYQFGADGSLAKPGSVLKLFSYQPAEVASLMGVMFIPLLEAVAGLDSGKSLNVTNAGVWGLLLGGVLFWRARHPVGQLTGYTVALFSTTSMMTFTQAGLLYSVQLICAYAVPPIFTIAGLADSLANGCRPAKKEGE